MSLRGGIGLPELPIKEGKEFRLGIMGGTFDPIHYGHLVTAEQARESLDLDAVLFMPAGSPAFKPPQVKLYFITGADAIIDIVTWHDAERIAELATFIAATRPGFDIDTARARIKESGLPFDVRYIQIPALAISSTNIRKRVARGMSVRYLTSESVLGYIRKRRLYADLGQEDFE